MNNAMKVIIPVFLGVWTGVGLVLVYAIGVYVRTHQL